jgi:2-iminobutanoate/2-iminopropanoate deaminase
MTKKIVHPDSLHRSPFYSHVVKVTRGALLFIAGQVPRDSYGNVVGKGSMGIQAKKAYENLKIALEAGGATLNDVVKTTIFVTSIEEFQKVSEIRRFFFPENPPPNTLVEVKRLAHPEIMFEIEAIAAIDDEEK